jgi:ABC-type uncharacterized transport system fused permease/ATPase subunit
MLSEKLPGVTVISIGRAATRIGLHHRTIEMTGTLGNDRAPVALAAVPA